MPQSPTRVVLVGFMGAGKSSVGQRLARKLGWRFVDIDDVVEAEAGKSVADIFTELGEAHFRSVEHEAARRTLALERVIVATGGGWAASPGRLASLPQGTFSVWLRVGAATAVERTAGGATVRPLLAGNRPVEAAERLLAERDRFYAAADVGVDTEGRSVEDVTARILEILAENGIRTGLE